MQDFTSAASVYQQLSQVCPEVEEYKTYHIQSMVKAGMYEEASNELLHSATMENGELQERLLMLQALLHFEQDEIQLAKNVLDNEAFRQLEVGLGTTTW